MKLSEPMRRNLARALACEPRPYRRVHYSQAKALERRGLVTIEFETMTHPIDKMLGSAMIRLTEDGRREARA